MSILKLGTCSLPETFSVPLEGSKSYTNRALTIAAIQNQAVGIENVSPSDDARIFCNALASLGYSTERSERSIQLSPSEVVPESAININIGPAGTCMRFLTALCATTEGCDVALHGTDRMHQRPIGKLVDCLQQLGAQISYEVNEGYPPLRIRGRALQGGVVSIDGGVSSQFISALLMIAPRLEQGLELTITGEFISESYVAMTCESMKLAGVSVEQEERVYRVRPGQRYDIDTMHIEGDASGASYLWSLAALSGKTVVVQNISSQSAQGDAKFPQLLKAMGCTVTEGVDHGIPWIAVTGSTTLNAIEADMTLMPDTAQTLAVIAACAKGTSRLTGLSSLRIKETDRIDAVVEELARCGIQVDAGPDVMEIHGGVPQSARIQTYDDHRMAMAFAPLIARVPWLEIEDPDVVGKSFPSFWTVLASAGVDVCTSC